MFNNTKFTSLKIYCPSLKSIDLSFSEYQEATKLTKKDWAFCIAKEIFSGTLKFIDILGKSLIVTPIVLFWLIAIGVFYSPDGFEALRYASDDTLSGMLVVSFVCSFLSTLAVSFSKDLIASQKSSVDTLRYNKLLKHLHLPHGTLIDTYAVNDPTEVSKS